MFGSITFLGVLAAIASTLINCIKSKNEFLILILCCMPAGLLVGILINSLYEIRKMKQNSESSISPKIVGLLMFIGFCIFLCILTQVVSTNANGIKKVETTIIVVGYCEVIFEWMGFMVLTYILSFIADL